VEVASVDKESRMLIKSPLPTKKAAFSSLFFIDTVNSRKLIGFPPEKKGWNDTPAIYDEHTLRIAGHPVMEDWEQGYMERLSNVATSQGGRVLELGYGMGLSARAIQSHGIDEHIVIECHPDVVKKCSTDFRKEIATGRMRVLSGFWQDITPLIKDRTFDGILFDTYPMKVEEIHSNHFWFFREAHRLLKKGGVLTYYSDEIDSFSERHLSKLLEAGFKRENVQLEICDVNPPEDCEYWQAKTIVVPKIYK
jgi:guanidinoacetate N-methyltransferase